MGIPYNPHYTPTKQNFGQIQNLVTGIILRRTMEATKPQTAKLLLILMLRITRNFSSSQLELLPPTSECFSNNPLVFLHISTDQLLEGWQFGTVYFFHLMYARSEIPEYGMWINPYFTPQQAKQQPVTIDLIKKIAVTFLPRAKCTVRKNNSKT